MKKSEILAICKSLSGLRISEQDTPEFAKRMGSDSDYPEYYHCFTCGIKIDGGGVIEGDFIYCNKCGKKKGK